MNNKIMLITYPDSMGNNLKDLHRILNAHFRDAIGGVHILPFFPSSADRGFAPVDYTQVDSAFGTWEDVKSISDDYYLMFDYMINHISAHSRYYKDFLEKKDASEYKDLFIRYKDFWENGEPTEKEEAAIYKRKPKSPYVLAQFADGTSEKVWCTFDDEQVDINVKSDTAKKFIADNLKFLASHGASIIRLDAFAYATKKAGTSCFFVEPDVWELLDECRSDLEGTRAVTGNTRSAMAQRDNDTRSAMAQRNNDTRSAIADTSTGDANSESDVMLLPEIHEHYTMPLKIADKGYFVYDFALPMLVLNALYYGNAQYLSSWLQRSPAHQFTTLDTHDGIGIVDVKDLLPDEEIKRTREDIFQKGANVKKIYNTSAYNNLDIYQVNCTFFSACGDNDSAYLLARAIQFFAKGIPQIYYVGMLAGRNDIELLEKTKVGRNINRHYFSEKEVENEIKRPVVIRLLELMKFRNECPAFDVDGSFETICENERLTIVRSAHDTEATLMANFRTFEFEIYVNGKCVKI